MFGASAFSGETSTDVIISIVEREPDPLSKAAPEPLQRIVMKALAKDPDERYQTAEEIATDLKSLKRDLELVVDLDAIRRKYHAAAKEQRKDDRKDLVPGEMKAAEAGAER